MQAKSIQEGRSRPGRPLPREHGAWALLYGPLVAGLLAARGLGVEELLLIVAATALFLAREPVARLVRGSRHGVRSDLRRYWIQWAMGWGLAGLAGVAVLVTLYGRHHLLLLGGGALPLLGLHLWLTERREDRSTPAELLGIIALALGAPAAWHTATGKLASDGWWLWFLCVLYFSSAVFFVKMQISRFLKVERFAGLRRRHIAYHVALVIVLAAVTQAGPVAPWVGVGFIPIIVRSVAGALRGPTKLNLKRVGYLEVAYTCWFVLWLGLAWRAVSIT